MQQGIDCFRMIRFLMLFLLSGFSHTVTAGICGYFVPDGNTLVSTPTADFKLLDDGTAEHQTTGLIWARCAWGQQWDKSGACQGTAVTQTWSDALKISQIANAQQYLGYSDWRVPNIKELGSIVETGCGEGSVSASKVNAEVFPDTPTLEFDNSGSPEEFWSASAYADVSGEAWNVNFYIGDITNRNKNELKSVRLVRGGGQQLDPDTMPDAFSFSAQENVALSANITSNTITVSGINTAVSINIQNGEYRINDSSWGNTNQTVNNGDTLQVRHTSAVVNNTRQISTVVIGDISVEFSSRTETFIADTTPEIFSFTTQKKVGLNTRVNSNTVTVSGINTMVSVSIQSGEYRINGGSWGDANQTVSSGETLQVRHTSANAYNTPQVSTLTIGGLSVEFASRTETETVVEPTELDYGYVEGSISDACTGQPLAFVNVQFANVTQQSDKNGEYSIRLENGDYSVNVSSAGYTGDSRAIEIQSSTRYEPFALAPPGGCRAAGAQSYKAVIVAAGGQYIEGTFNQIWPSTQRLVDRAFTALKSQGFGDANIYYLSADTSARDADDDGKDDIDAEATLENLEYALTEWAGDVEDVVVYLIGHGGQQVIQLERYSPLPAIQLNTWLNDLQTQITGKLSVVLDACYSGSFIAPLAAKDRYVMASTRQDLLAVISNQGSASFSYHFWDEVVFTGRLGLAFRRAEQATSKLEVGKGKRQAAILDTNGDRTRTAADYEEISEYCFGACNSKASVAPEIESVGLIEGLAGQLSAKLSLTTPASFPVVKGWVTIQRPDYNFPMDNSAIHSLPQLDLNCQSNRCTGVYNNFNLNGEYLFTFYVENSAGQVSLPRSTKILQSERDDREYSASSVYEPSTGLLTLKDVSAGGLHYYAELQNEGGYAFSLKYLQPLSGATQSRISQFDGQRVIIPSVFAFGDYYAIDLLPEQSLFKLDLGSIKTVK